MDIREVEAMLPEYVNGQLSLRDAQVVERAMEQFDDVKSEEKFLNQLRSAVKEEDVQSPSDWGLTRLLRSISKTTSNTQHNTSWWKVLAVAASFAFVIQTGALIFDQIKIDDTYIPLSTSGLENTIQVVFEKSATEAQISNLLAEIGGNIVSGPSASGVYRITSENIETALNLLVNSEIIAHANKEE